MKKLLVVLCLIIASTAFAQDVTCINQGGVKVTIQKLGYDAKGAVFKGQILKNGRVLRNSMMRLVGSNIFSLYAMGKDGQQGWSFTVRSKRGAYITDGTEYLNLAREMGYSNREVVCDRNLPLVYWNK